MYILLKSIVLLKVPLKLHFLPILSPKSFTKQHAIDTSCLQSFVEIHSPNKACWWVQVKALKHSDKQILTAGLKMSISWWAQFRSPVNITGFNFSSSCQKKRQCLPRKGALTNLLADISSNKFNARILHKKQIQIERKS